MGHSKKQKSLKYILYCLLILSAALIQNVNGLFPQIFGARCFLLLPVTIILVVGEEEKNAGLIGLFAGLIWDMTSSVHMGFNSIFLMFACFFAAASITYITRDIFITNILFAISVTLVYCLLYWLLFIVIRGVDNAGNLLLSFYLPCALYTSAISPIIWLILKPIKKKFTSI